MELPGGLATSILGGFPLDVAVLDESGEIVWANRAWREYSHRHGQGRDVVGRDYTDLTAAMVDEPYARHIRGGLERILGTGREGFSVEYPRHDETELRWYSLYATALDHDGQGYCLVVQEDVTEQWISDLLTEARREEAATLNRMLTHEVRNAVGSAVGWLGLLDVDTDRADRADRVERISTSLGRIERAVDDSARVLDLAHGHPSFERVDIESVAESAWNRGDRGEVSLAVRDRFPVICYPKQTVTLLESLFDSATGGSGVTTVRIRLGDGAFYVEDDRSEPVPASPERAFGEAPLRRDGGFAFGLSLARPLARMNGWRLSLDTSPLGGWQFTVRTDQIHV
jgi:signal transduction histidine kinase